MLLKVDRTSMASSVEVRSPFVDHRLVEYIFSTRATYIDKNNPKKLLKDILSEDFNNDFLNRPKQGFVFSVEDWVFKNKQLVVNAILDVNNFEVFDKSKLDKLYLRKTRINGLRLWRIFLINRYLDLNL
jgi:asparagine synthase (glutamine-hydrolysing)